MPGGLSFNRLPVFAPIFPYHSEHYIFLSTAPHAAAALAPHQSPSPKPGTYHKYTRPSETAISRKRQGNHLILGVISSLGGGVAHVVALVADTARVYAAVVALTMG